MPKALEKSARIIIVTSPRFIAFMMSSRMACKTWMADCPLLYSSIVRVLVILFVLDLIMLCNVGSLFLFVPFVCCLIIIILCHIIIISRCYCHHVALYVRDVSSTLSTQLYVMLCYHAIALLLCSIIWYN